MLNPERPITNTNEDFLTRCHFVTNLSDAIVKYKEKDCLTISLQGQWGSGKTSIINMLKENLERHENIIIFDFKPWLFSDTEQLINNFFKEFAKKVDFKTDNSEKLINLGKKLEAYSSFFEPFSMIPEPTLAGGSKFISRFLSKFGKASTKIGEAHKKTLSQTKDDIEKDLLKIDKKFLIIIDDIDRLNNLEIKQIFQLIKALGDFSNIIYLLSMDKDIIVNALSEVQNRDGNSYLEKVINVPIDVPVINKEDLEKLLLESIKEIIKEHLITKDEKEYYKIMIAYEFKTFFINIRDIQRYLNLFKFNFHALEHNVNVIDLAIITAFQIFEHEIYNFMKSKQFLLLGQYLLNEIDEIDLISNSLRKISKENFISLLNKLFPNCKYFKNQIKSENFNNKNVYLKDYFNIYFSLTLNEKIYDKKMENFINKIKNENDFEASIKELATSNVHNILGFLEGLDKYPKTAIKKTQSEIIVKVLISLGDIICKEKEYYEKYLKPLLNIIKEIIERFEDKKEKYRIYKDAINNAETLLIPCLCVDTICKIQHEYESSSLLSIFNFYLDDEILSSDSEKVELRNILLEKINLIKTDHNLLFNSIRANFILRIWKILDKEDCLEFIENNISNKEFLLNFLKIFIYYEWKPNAIKEFNNDEMKEFINYELILNNLNSLNENLSEDEIFCIENLKKISIDSNKKL
ncbi:KAP family P-loop NTPase fold protein [Aliarcobacter butzleri]|uniref:KAP family P-loop NTPase fold protein n=1 Tax=Aliarcobacter butzleri TaxID=28197 RepID=UPI00344FFA04